MIAKIHTTPQNSEKLTKLWRWLRALDDAIHHDPSDALHRRIEHLELKMRNVDASVGPL